MSQVDRALFLYGFDITNDNQFINFRAVSSGPILTAIIPVGNYTCTEFLFQVQKQMQLKDPANTYSIAINRTIPTVISNRVSISTSGGYLDLLFGTGVNAANSCALLLGFLASDYTGATVYTGANQSGNIIFPDYPIYNYLGPQEYIMNDMSKSVSASGIKETLVFAQMQFLEGSWKYINNFNGNTQLTQWETFLQYAIRQLKMEFTQSVYENPNVVYPVTLEATSVGKDGGGYKLELMNKDGLFRFYETGNLQFRVIPAVN